MERAPNFTVQLTRPSRFPRERAKEAWGLSDTLSGAFWVCVCGLVTVLTCSSFA